MLTRFPSAMDRAAGAVLNLAEIVRFFRTSQGDLTFLSLMQMQEALREAALAALAVLAEGPKKRLEAEAFMKSVGGPATLSEFGAIMQGFRTASAVWNADLQAVLQGLPASSLVQLIDRPAGPIFTKHIEFIQFIPAEQAATLRASQGLADLQTLLEQAGA